MQKEKVHTEKPVGSPKTKKGINPFIKLMVDQELIAQAVKNNQPLSSLKYIKFVSPL
jgi:hypothetical protein